ncbi:hypothetical protein MYAM1_000828 [Malassezia yamatoensis]|uniref:Zn(2)-C6 fungal-type domain-containing protein n=1 Tax=Malassezia yamatoensis TaxID=253288 RepID=A0AAJ5YSR6_9BASI|nr:hypothetical protein MYAM1_000828 [Malassezia yamatoensis]
MSRDNVDSLQAHALPPGVQSAQTFTMGDHPSQHYHSVDALSSNVLPGATRERLTGHEPQGKPPSTKRRKINTCFPCKNRKVKCDRQQPYCGQCQKHRIPAERCVWSADISMGSELHPHAGMSFSKDGAHTLNLPNDWASAHGHELALDNDTRTVVDRISHLEQRLGGPSSQASSHDMHNAATGSQIDPLLLGTTLALDVNTDRHNASLPQDSAVVAELAFWRNKIEQQQRAVQNNEGNPLTMQAEPNMAAADALAMFARHSQQGALGSNDQSLHRAGSVAADMQGSSSEAEGSRSNIVNALLDHAAFNTNASRIRTALDMLPDQQQMDYLLRTLQTVDLHVSYGISWRLVNMQLASLRSQLASWNRMQTALPEHLDLSFLSLLLMLLGLAARYCESRFFIEQAFCTSVDQITTLVDAWVDSAQALMAMDDFVNKTNWNHLAALLLVANHHALRGKLPLCLTTVAMMVRLAELQGYHKLGSAREDQDTWSQAPTSTQVRLSSVVGVPNSDSSRSETLIKPSINMSCTLPDRSHLVREAARRLWYKIACEDLAVSTVLNRSASFDAAGMTTQYPLNIDEEDLPDSETHVLPPALEEGRATINNLTPYTFQIARLGSERISEAANKTQSYDLVLEMDGKLRQLLSSLPIYLRPDPALEQLPEVRREQSQRPYLAMHRLIIFEAVNHQLLMLHREYMCRGHHEEQYASSTRIAVDAARTILSCRQQIDNVHPSVQRHPIFLHHLFQAATVLALNLKSLVRDGQGSSQVAHQLRDDLSLMQNYIAESNDVAGGLAIQSPQSHKIAFRLLDLLLAQEGITQSNGDSSQKAEPSSPEKSMQHSISGIGMNNGSAGNNLFQISANSSNSDEVNESAKALASHMLDAQFGTDVMPTEFFASLDELMVPIY